jgi:hypothetical protein
MTLSEILKFSQWIERGLCKFMRITLQLNVHNDTQLEDIEIGIYAYFRPRSTRFSIR